MTLDRCLDEIKTLFSGLDRREIHLRARPWLQEIAGNRELLFEVQRRNLSVPGYFTRLRGNPVMALNVFENKAFTLLINCWPPHSTGSSDITHQSIHHHGKMLLTSASVFGEGYESVLFKKGYTVDEKTGVAQLEVDKFYRNHAGTIEFVETFTPHVVFYPSSLSLTLVLWSNEQAGPVALESMKRLGFLRKHKVRIKGALSALGLTGALGINKPENFDFYPENGVIRQLPVRIQYGGGTADNFAQNIFYVLQHTGFNDHAFLRKLKAGLPGPELATAGRWIDAFLAGTPIESCFEPEHHRIERVTLNKADIFACFPGLSAHAVRQKS